MHNFVDIFPSSFGPWYPLVSFFHHFSSFFSFAILGSVIVVVVYFFAISVLLPSRILQKLIWKRTDINYTLWPCGRLSVKVFKTLNDRQSNIFNKFDLYLRIPTNPNYHMSIKKSQEILKCFIDLKSSVWFRWSQKTKPCFVTLRTFFRSTGLPVKVFKTLNDWWSYILNKFD